MAFKISLHAMLWRPVIMFEMVWCLHPERMCRELSDYWQRGHVSFQIFHFEGAVTKDGLFQFKTDMVQKALLVSLCTMGSWSL